MTKTLGLLPEDKERIPSKPEALEDSALFVRTQEFKNRIAEVIGWAAEGKTAVIHTGPHPRALVQRDPSAQDLGCLDAEDIKAKPQAYIRSAFAGESFFLDEHEHIVLKAAHDSWNEPTREHHWREAYAADPEGARRRSAASYRKNPAPAIRGSRKRRLADPKTARQSVRRSRERRRSKKREARAEEFAARVESVIGQPVRRLPEFGLLSAREKEVLELMIRGLSHAEVAKELGIAPTTVSTLRSRALDKLDTVSIKAVIHSSTKIESSGG